MAEEKMQHNQDCGNDLHEHHLCFLMHEGMHYQNSAQYKELVQDAQYRCQQCGRTAKNEKNLCMPVAL